MNVMNFGPAKGRSRLVTTNISMPSGSFEAWVTKINEFVSDTCLRLVRVETRLDQIDRRLDEVDARLDRMDIRLDRIDVRLDRIDVCLDRIETRLDHMTISFHKEINNLTLRLVTFVCGFGTALVTATYFVAMHGR